MISLFKEARNSLSMNPEELTLDYIEIQAIPPLPLWLLLEADKEKQQIQPTKETKEDVIVNDYFSKKEFQYFIFL